MGARSRLAFRAGGAQSGGLLILGVPNNDGFVDLDESFAGGLNQPPHHMGLWGRCSLEALARLFPMQALALEVEPLAELGWYQAVLEKRYLRSWMLRKRYYWLGGEKLVSTYAQENAASIAGHSILAVYMKSETVCPAVARRALQPAIISV